MSLPPETQYFCPVSGRLGPLRLPLNPPSYLLKRSAKGGSIKCVGFLPLSLLSRLSSLEQVLESAPTRSFHPLEATRANG